MKARTISILLGITGVVMLAAVIPVVIWSTNEAVLNTVMAMFFIGFLILAIARIFYQKSTEDDWNEVARIREFSFLQHKVSGKRIYLRRTTLLNKNEVDWLNGKTDQITS